MMKLHVFGSCSGTEPQPGRHHTSWALECDGKLYWFDAGENCAHTACSMGLELRTIQAVFISHPHIDHVGGLPHLLWSIDKTRLVQKDDSLLKFPLYLPVPEIWDLTCQWLTLCGKHEDKQLQITPETITDRLLFDDGTVSVEARHNFHIQTPDAEKFTSYSFRIRANGKTIIFSGDVKHWSDPGDWLDDCDLLLMETGHHKSSEVCAQLKQDRPGVRDIIFIHHGRELLNDFDAAKQRAEAAWQNPVKVASDASTFEL